MITGESGVGKELIARAIHENSRRSDFPFVSVNCSAIPESLLESELFGHSKGSFTGASRERKGLFEEASGGTLFLDEIGDLNLLLQSKLLRVLQEKKVRLVGDNKMRNVDVRIISATNKNLIQEVKNGNFREDLYYRLNVIPLHVPPLRQRKEDIPILANYFLEKFSKKNERGVLGFTEAAKKKLSHMHFKGNVRELQNVIERSVVLSHGKWITDADIPVTETFDDNDLVYEVGADLPTLKSVEDRYIKSVLKKMNGEKLAAAKVLGISRRTLYRRLTEIEDDRGTLTPDPEKMI